MLHMPKLSKNILLYVDSILVFLFVLFCVLPQLISRQISVIENFWNFRTVRHTFSLFPGWQVVRSRLENFISHIDWSHRNPGAKIRWHHVIDRGNLLHPFGLYHASPLPFGPIPTWSQQRPSLFWLLFIICGLPWYGFGNKWRHKDYFTKWKNETRGEKYLKKVLFGNRVSQKKCICS